MEDKDKMDRDDLIKSLQELDFSEAEIDDIVSKAEKDDKFAPKEKEDDDKSIDEEAQEKVVDKDDMKKSFDKVMAMKADLDKSMEDFLNKYGNAPGIKTPDTDLEKVKAIDEDILKSEINTLEKSFSSRLDEIQKSFTGQNEINNELLKSIQKVNETVNMIAETPNPFKGVFGNYKGNILEKGEKFNEGGKRVVSLRNKELATDEFQKAIDKVEDENDKQTIRDMISDYTISNKTSTTGLNIVKKALDIDFEK